MEFLYITTGELMDFIHSDLYRSWEYVPVSSLRAKSLSRYPYARKEDVLLVVAVDGERRILGFAGALPDRLPESPEERIAWNSGWWVHPQHRSSGVALPLFYELLKAWDKRIMLSDMTPHSRRIIQSLNYFTEVLPVEGYIYYFRFPVADRQLPGAVLIDRILNSPVDVSAWVKSRLRRSAGYRVEYLPVADEEAAAFIRRMNRNFLFRRDAEHLSQMMAYPWLGTKDELTDTDRRYPFSVQSRRYEHEVVKIYRATGELAAVLYITVRDSTMKIPYAYYDSRDADLVAAFTVDEIRRRGFSKLLVFSKELTGAMERLRPIPYLSARPVSRVFAVSRDVLPLLPESYEFQDGYGDVVFT